MSKKFNNKVLLIVFVALGAVLVLTEFFHKKDKNLKTDLADFNIEEVAKIKLHPQNQEKDIIITKKGDNKWYVTEGEKTYASDQEIVTNYLEELQKLKSQRLAAKSKEKWDKFNVTDSAATNIKLLDAKGKSLLDLLIGKLSYKQAQNSYGRNNVQGISYVRLANEKEVYAVDGFLPMSLNRSFDDWRNKTLTKLNKEDIKQISFVYPDSSFTIEYKDSIWSTNKAQIDDKKVESFLSSLQNKKGYKFNNDFKNESSPVYQLKLTGDNMSDIEINCYVIADNKFVIHSNQNTEANFESDDKGLVKQLFKSINYFTKKE